MEMCLFSFSSVEKLSFLLFGYLESCHIHPITHLIGWIECMYSMWGAICQHCIEFFSFFFPPPGRLSPIISTFHVCKAGAPWGILCPLHPLLCWGFFSSWHLALPVQPLCRCLYSQLPCICPRPLLQPVYQPGLYSRYSFIYKATQLDQNPIKITLFGWFPSIMFLIIKNRFSQEIA